MYGIWKATADTSSFVLKLVIVVVLHVFKPDIDQVPSME